MPCDVFDDYYFNVVVVDDADAADFDVGDDDRQKYNRPAREWRC
jgi:hypothetical protein